MDGTPRPPSDAPAPAQTSNEPEPEPEPETRRRAPSELAATELHPGTATGLIQWSFTTTPSEAQLFIAGEPRGRTPIAIDVPLGEDLVEVRLELDGHVPQSFKLSPTRDQSIARELAPLTTVKPVTKRAHKPTNVENPDHEGSDEKRFIPVPESLRDE